MPVVFEISSWNADKGFIDSAVLRERLQQFAAGAGGPGFPVVVTRMPLFVGKARLFPKAYFLIGADTVKVSACSHGCPHVPSRAAHVDLSVSQRLLDVKYYGHSLQNMVLALAEILHLEGHFVVGGRVKDGKFITLEVGS
jgi:hypothetical protein